MKKILIGLLMLFATMANAYQVYTPAGIMDMGYSNLEGVKRTYSATISNFTPVATATDIVTLVGVAGKIVSITDVRITGVSTSGANVILSLVKRTALNTGGTSSVVTPVIHDSSDVAASAVVNKYTVNPSALGTGNAFRADYVSLTAVAAPAIVFSEWDFANRPAKAIKLKSASESFALNLGGAAVPAGTVLQIVIEWTEE